MRFRKNLLKVPSVLLKQVYIYTYYYTDSTYFNLSTAAAGKY